MAETCYYQYYQRKRGNEYYQYYQLVASLLAVSSSPKSLFRNNRSVSPLVRTLVEDFNVLDGGGGVGDVAVGLGLSADGVNFAVHVHQGLVATLVGHVGDVFPLPS